MEKKKTITNIFKIHPLTYIFIFLSFFTAKFKDIIIFMSLIIFHELGHFLTAVVFNWNIDKIYIYPLGGLTKFNDKINKPIYEELLVTIMGPIFQIFLSLVFKNNNENIIHYSNILLFFNLLPITPLDGSKILNIFLSIIVPFKTSLKIIIKISYFIYFLLIFYSIFQIKSYFFIFIIFLLLFKIIDENKKISYYFNKFITERLLYNYSFKRTSIINNINKLYKYRNNIIKEKNKIISEKEALQTKISKNQV